MTTGVPVLVLVDDGYFGQEGLQQELGPDFSVSLAASAAEAHKALSTLVCPIVLAPRTLEPVPGDAVLADLAAHRLDFIGALMIDADIDRLGEGVQAVIRRPLRPGALRLQLQAIAAQREKYLAARAEADRLGNDLSRLADGLRHDMRGQLQSVIGLASLLLELERPRRLPDDELIDFVTRINAAGDRLTRFVDALGDWLVAARRPLELGAVDLVDLTREAIAKARALRSIPRGPGDVEIAFELPEEEPLVAHVRGDPRMLLKALEVLIARATNNQKPALVRLMRADEGWQLGVYDIMPKALTAGSGERVFRLFERYGGGDGIGLALVHKVAERHGASVEMVPVPSGGHEVVITFPWGTDG